MGRGAGRAESRFAAARPGTAGVYTPRPRYGGQIAFWGLGAERQTGLCATQRIGGRLDNLALQNCLLPTELVIRSIHPLRDIYMKQALKSWVRYTLGFRRVILIDTPSC